MTPLQVTSPPSSSPLLAPLSFLQSAASSSAVPAELQLRCPANNNKKKLFPTRPLSFKVHVASSIDTSETEDEDEVLFINLFAMIFIVGQRIKALWIMYPQVFFVAGAPRRLRPCSLHPRRTAAARWGTRLLFYGIHSLVLLITCIYNKLCGEIGVHKLKGWSGWSHHQGFHYLHASGGSIFHSNNSSVHMML